MLNIEQNNAENGLSGNFEKEITNIRRLIKHERFTQAAQQASRLLFLDPTQIKAYYYRAIAYANMCDIHSALLDMQRVIELEPLNAKAAAWCASLNFSEGLLLQEKKQFAGALKHFSRASQYDRHNINSRLFAALSHIALGQYPDAVGSLLEAKKTMHHPYIDALLANLSLHFDKLAEAYKQANDALAVDPQNSIALKVLDKIKIFVDKKMSTIDEMLMNDRREAALLEINSLLEIRPDLVPIRVHKAMIMRSAGNLAEAERELIDILEHNPNVEAQRQLALTYNDMGIGTFMNGHPQEAIAWFDAAMRESSDDPNFFVNKGDCYRALNDYETAMANYHRAMKCGLTGESIAQRVAITHYSIARAALKRANNKAALFELNKAIEASQDFPDFFIVRAKVRVTLNQFEESLEDLFMALKIDPENAEAKKLLNMQHTSPQKPAKPKPKIRRVATREAQPYSIDDLRSKPFDFISGTKRLPQKF
ncbi:TPR Domain containing protein [Tritrichomonas foetus]|uniref:TPR Domain containing protein n=1 Tax=Tritrichomonas foetus TaxID=1144522 RepID=A0A1J4JBF8_9EUKA|nr:TPR Domain containing protein [Tritrichomonas foetus]|eukprot:OHS96518.1 TPR Domain containing protein [Tritrichomonas foetus]